MKIKICNLSELEEKNYFVKWVDKIRDEVIVFKHEKSFRNFGSEFVVLSIIGTSLNVF